MGERTASAARFSVSTPWVGCPQRRVPINTPWTKAELKRQIREFKQREEAAGAKVPSATTQLMQFCDNYERTCKYTALSFLPSAIALQFRRMANVYFLVVGGLYTVNSISPVQGVTRFGTIGALCVVILASLVSEGLQDLSRFRQDTEMNAKQCQVLRDGRWASVRWRDVKVGDFLRIKQDEQFPADFLILASDNRSGRVYIETASLDGETNLKVYNAKKEIVEMMDSHPGGSFVGEDALIKRLASLEGELRCNPPDNQLYSWSGAYHDGSEKKLCNVATEQLLLRGAVLRKSAWVVGLVVFTGMQTKLKMNDEETRPKQTQVEQMMNEMIGHVLKVQMTMILLFATLKFTWMGMHEQDQKYLTGLANEISVFEAVKSWCTWLLLLSAMIPISLYVTLEVVKTVMKRFMDNDYAMYYAKTNTPAEARTASLHEELGQVEYVFSDKTGTLTSNEMELMKACVDTEVWGDGKPIGLFRCKERIRLHDDSDETATPILSTMEADQLVQAVEINVEEWQGLAPGEALRCVDPENGAALGWVQRTMLQPATEPWMNTDHGLGPRTRQLVADTIAAGSYNAEQLELFWTLMCVCHQTEAEHPDTPERKANSARVLETTQRLNKNAEELVALGKGVEAMEQLVKALEAEDEEYDEKLDGEIQYSAASPDDKALVEGARKVGFTFLARSESTIVVRILGKVKRFEALCIIPFNSDRKRMSIVTQEVSHEGVAAKRVVHMLYEKCTGTKVFDKEKQRALMDPKSPEFSAAYLAAFLKSTDAMRSRSPPRIWTKGADSIMKPLLRLADDQAKAKMEKSWSVMSKFATVGLRTLVVGTRTFAKGEPQALDFDEWLKRLSAANGMDEGKAKTDAMAKVHAEVESDINMHGCSAIEDKLQDGVTATLPKLSRAGIKVWVLTGDKTDTAIEIGMSCNLLTRSQNVVILEEWDPDDHGVPHPGPCMSDIDPRVLVHTRAELMRLLRELDEKPDGAPLYGPMPTAGKDGGFARFGDGTLHFPEDPKAHGVERYGLYPEDWPEPVGKPSADSKTNSARTVWPLITKRPLERHPLAIVIHASVLKAAMDEHTCDENGLPVDKSERYQGGWVGGGGFRHGKTTYYSCLDVFAELGRRCSVVLCCRVSPRQKAQVVAMGKERFQKICLAIGDGANDVPMIKEAHIGVGISGHEGMQAVLASDYAIAQFRFLERLLLVHGRWSYKRIARLVMFFFYKNSLYGLTAMWMCRHNGYTGMSLFDGMVGSGYNLVTTSMPIFVVALTDRDLTDETVLNHPETYIFSQRGVHLSHTNFATWAGGALWNSMVLYFTMMYALSEPDSQGREMDLHMISMAVFASLHVQVHVKLIVAVSSWTTIAAIINVLSVATWFVLWPLYTQVYGMSWGLAPNLWYTFVNVTSDLRFWLALALSVFICVLSDIAAKFIWRNFEHLYRHPVEANSLKFQLQREYRGLPAKQRKLQRSHSETWAREQASLNREKADKKRLHTARQRVMIGGKEVVLPVGSYTASYVEKKVAEESQVGEPEQSPSGSQEKGWKKAFKKVKLVEMATDGGLSQNARTRITASALGRSEEGQNKAVAEDTFGRQYRFTPKAALLREYTREVERGNAAVNALRSAGFAKTLEARRMAIMAAIATPEHEDDEEMLTELKQITDAMAHSLVSPKARAPRTGAVLPPEPRSLRDDLAAAVVEEEGAGTPDLLLPRPRRQTEESEPEPEPQP